MAPEEKPSIRELDHLQDSVDNLYEKSDELLKAFNDYRVKAEGRMTALETRVYVILGIVTVGVQPALQKIISLF